MLRIPALCLFVAVSFASELPDELTAETFAEVTKQGPHFIKFYAPWCGHCQRLAPVWDSLAAQYNEGSSIRIAKLDCTQHTTVCSQQGVSGYPTLKFIHGSEEKRYQGKRDLSELSSFADEMLKYKEEQKEMASKPEVIDGLVQLTSTTFDSTVPHGYYFIKFYAPWCGHCQRLAPTWAKLAAHFKDDKVVNVAKIDCTQEKDVCAKNNVGGYPTLFLFKDGDNIQRYTGGRSLEELIAFVDKHRPAEEKPGIEEMPAEEESPESSVIELTAETFSDIIKEGTTLVKFFAPWCGHCKRLAPVWDQLGQIVKDEHLPIRIAKLDCTANSQICEENHVHGYPTLILFRNGVKDKEYKGSRVLEDLVQFVSDNAQ